MNELNLTIDNHFVSNAQLLFDRLLREVQWDERMQARKTASFGVPYNYSGISYPFQPMPKILLPLVKDIEARFNYRPNNCLINYYDNGESKMGFHSDAIENLADNTGVIIVSLGAERAISFQNKHDKSIEREIWLTSGSLLLMSQEVQKHWKHAILKHKEIEDGRISLTFRLFAGESSEQ